MDQAQADRIRRCIEEDEDRLRSLRAAAGHGADWLSLRRDIARLERRLDRARASLGSDRIAA